MDNMRTKRLETYVNEDEFHLITETAQKEGLSVSEYLRIAALVDAFVMGNRKAWELTFKGATKMTKAYLANKMAFLTGKLLGHNH